MPESTSPLLVVSKTDKIRNLIKTKKQVDVFLPVPPILPISTQCSDLHIEDLNSHCLPCMTHKCLFSGWLPSSGTPKAGAHNSGSCQLTLSRCRSPGSWPGWISQIGWNCCCGLFWRSQKPVRNTKIGFQMVRMKFLQASVCSLRAPSGHHRHSCSGSHSAAQVTTKEHNGVQSRCTPTGCGKEGLQF